MFHQKVGKLLSQSHTSFGPIKRMLLVGSLDGDTLSPIKMTPTDILPRHLIEQAAVRFFAEVNSVIYVLSQREFSQLINNIYFSQEAERVSTWALVMLIYALGAKNKQAFERACFHLDGIIEEGSIESVKAILLIVILSSVSSALRILTSVP